LQKVKKQPAIPFVNSVTEYVRLIPIVERHVSNTAFVAAFLTSLYTNSCDLDLKENEVFEMYRSILSKALGVFKIGLPPSGFIPTTKSSDPQPVLLVKLVKRCDAMSIENLKADIFEALLNYVRESFTQDLWHDTIRPFISSICEYLGERASDSPISAEKAFITMMIDVCLPKYVGTPPQRPGDWKRKLPGTCRCDDCRLLCIFVRSPHEKDICFRLTKPRRAHLANQLDRTFLTTTVREGTPHALKVEKTYKRYEMTLHSWRKKAAKMRSELTSLADNTPLVSIIGDDQYKRLLEHECFQIPKPKQPNTHLHAVRRDSGSDSVQIPKKRTFVDLSTEN
jgi:hypothetical protein